jgi:hypothetical protein
MTGWSSPPPPCLSWSAWCAGKSSVRPLHLFAIYCLLFGPCCLLPAVCSLLPVSCRLLPADLCLLPAACSLLLAACWLVSTPSYLQLLSRSCCSGIKHRLLYYCHAVVTLLLHCYTMVAQASNTACSYTVVALLSHCCYTVVTLLLHCCYTVVTLLLHCCRTVAA